jgi:AcrR family transcriptional regulator
MSYLAERREEEKERRRLEIIEAAERLYARQGWDGLTMDQLAREARLSRALLYVYFHDRADLHLAIVTRAFRLLRQRFHEAAARAATGLDQVQAIGRAYIAYAHEFPYYFDACSRFQAARHPADGSPELDACAQAGDGTIAEVVAALEAGRRDGSIRADLGPTASTATALWGFTHGILQLMATKSAELARQGVALDQFADHSLALLRHALRAAPAPTPGS